MCVIYRARQRHSRRIVAVKRILTYHADSQETLVRFRREAEAVAKLDHPNILPIYEVGENEDGLPSFSMKFAAGGSLVDAGPALRNDPRRIVSLMAKVARAVQYAHEQGILHRDLKPGNILLDGHGEPMVSDFGLAKWLDTTSNLTQTLTIFGTPGYIAPEQANGPAAKLTPTADIYSLGAILFDLLAGQPPFLGEHALAVIQQAAEKPAPKLRSLTPRLDHDLETICANCLEREPNARYRSAGDLAEALERWLAGRHIIARPVSAPVRALRWSRRNPLVAGMGALLFALGTAVGIMTWESEAVHRPLMTGIAVLPFENLSDAKESAFFADGIQDGILTKLAKVADLRVISRTSVMEYRGARNTQQIGRALNVSHVLEGSVHRNADKIHVNAKLIDTRTDTYVWAEEYDGDLTDMFALQSEIAQKVADHLQTKVSVVEKAAIAEPHLAVAQHLYWAYRDYDRAHQELVAARRTLPNESRIPLLAGYIDRRQGHWEKSLDEMKQALELDPRNFSILQQISLTYEALRHYREMAASLDRALIIAPKDVPSRVRRAWVDLESRANPKPLHTAIETILAEDPNAAPVLVDLWLDLALRERDPAAAERVLAAMPAGGCYEENIPFPNSWCEGVVARLRGDEQAARAAFISARKEIEQTVRDQPDYAAGLCALGVVDAALGNKEDAIREGRRAVELIPVSKSAIEGPMLIQYLAVIYAWTGDKDRAIERLAETAKLPGSHVTYGYLRLNPLWDPLRGDSRFDKIVASLAPK